ncbi:MAG: nucleoside triphosphate pyrophosphohydrolase [Nitrospirae bacterium]|jgi:tetrapyrrole methylase family protein/MazG family protein|nr:nucleoside triphosphate pyrophosphohydrolase [Nitrospirota bacterium]
MNMKIKNLVEIMKKLRSKNGCPWDKKQTRESLKPYLIEEAYEVLEAIEENNPEKIKEELGDLLFQIIFHCQIAKERNEFDINDVIESISQKMISRHPHVFGESECHTPEDVIKQWEVLKKREGKLRSSILEGVPKAMPSLLRAHRLQKRAAQAGFDWEKLDDVLLKLDEEIEEFKDAIKKGNKEMIEEEFGDIMFMFVNLSRFIGINPEDAHRKTISKFIHRFRYIETKAAEQNKELSEMTLKEMDKLWDEAKSKEIKYMKAR